MKRMRPTLAFLGTAAVGFAGMTAYRHFQSTPPPSDQASALSPAIPSASTEPVTNTKVDGSLPSSSDNPAATAQWRALLTQFNIPLEWAEVLAAPDASLFPEWYSKLEKLTNDDSRKLLLELFFSRWASLNPEGALTFLKAKEDKSGISWLFRQWVIVDSSQALTLASSNPEYLYAALNSLAINDPAKYFDWFNVHTNLSPYSFLGADSPTITAALESLATFAPEHLLTWAGKFPPSTYIARIMALTLSRKNLAGTLAWAESIESEGNRNQALMAVASVMAETDPERALALFLSLKNQDSERTQMEVTSLFRKLGSLNPEKCLAAARSIPAGFIRDGLVSNILDNQLSGSPARAFTMADILGFEALPDFTTGPPKELRGAAQARQVLEAALDGEPTMFRQRTAQRAISTWMEEDPAALATFLEGKMNSPLLAGIKLAEDLAASGEPISPELMRVLGVRPEHQLNALAQKEPAAAAAQLSALPDPAARQNSVEVIAKSWGSQDRKNALMWAGTLTNPQEQAAAWKSIARPWLQEDSQQASTWIASLPAGPPRDATVVVMAEQILTRDPDLAWEWALTLTDPDLKFNTLQKTATAWLANDAASLQQALTRTPLTSAERTALQNTLSPASR